MIRNSLGIDLPERVGDYVVRPYAGPENPQLHDGPVVNRRVAGLDRKSVV